MTLIIPFLMGVEFNEVCPVCGGHMARGNKYCRQECYLNRKQEPGQTTLTGGNNEEV